jgi:PPK2 family polyphosphate:nucleotide phosphotransferase
MVFAGDRPPRHPPERPSESAIRPFSRWRASCLVESHSEESQVALTYADVSRLFQVKPGHKFNLKDHDPGWAGGSEFKELRTDELKARSVAFLQKNTGELADAQELLYASDVHSVLIVLQAMDAAGKDGTIKHVMSGVNPQGCQVFSFKKPSDEELDHNFLWRYMKALPERGRIGIFNRSYYEDVLVVRVHPEILAHQKLPPGDRDQKFWDNRFDDINRFERHLVRNGTLILKFFLHLSKKEQKKRFLARLEDEDKQWKFSFADLKEREFWDDYQAAFADMLRKTSTKWAPWWVIPADHKFITRALVAGVTTASIKHLGLKRPSVTADQRRLLSQAKRQLGSGK